MADDISDEMIEYVGILAKLELSEEEKRTAKRDMGRMLDYVELLNELDTTGIEPVPQVFPVCNVFREDVLEDSGKLGKSAETAVREDILANAPEQKDGAFVVPRTIG
ncbi:MAG: Asp-tRNA(Asn)/Glu-tRNA(Gln) amidotransferase subunit GatC [Lachnospiraceae bacterium]|nr:Asp-tRNA(Asn)/Glu-tRNA(Gln) amidotransferase subunit GatC [Lachnospiraceae bacterium]